MRNHVPEQIAVRISFDDIGDGRTYVTSPDLHGFHVVVQSDEDLTQAVVEPLRAFLRQYLGADIAGIGAADAPVGYRARSVGLELTEHKRPSLLFAEIASA